MDLFFFCVVLFLFLLAVFDLSVGVSNDAVNFLNSAIGSKAATFRTIIIVASVGVFLGAAMSNGMMEIARHGIFRPENFSFYDLICIFMAVMITDIILLDIFNTMGMPTSTTVSMVFELLGATFVVALIKMASDGTGLGFNDLLNTEKALSVILGIFLSVAIAFFFGTIVQFLSRLIFTFNYHGKNKWKTGIFGSVCATAIIYFLLIKGVKDLFFMTPELKMWISDNTLLIIGCCLVGCTLLMRLLQALKVNVLKVVILMGTFALAMAFAGNDLVNFIGVPLSGLSAFHDFTLSGGGDATTHMMGALNGPADTSVWFLIGAGVIMVVALSTSKKARKVSQTEIGLGSQNGDDELFGSSRFARRIVRWALTLISWVRRYTPVRVRRWMNRRFDTGNSDMDTDAAFDLIRGSVNLVLAGVLIAIGTSMKLPLSTTFVTFMVAMGTSLADRAWGRESAVFRITGVITVISGWFLTATAAFIGAGVIVLLMHLGGVWVMLLLAIAAIVLIIRSNRKFNKNNTENESDTMLRTILTTTDNTQTWPLFLLWLSNKQLTFIEYAHTTYLSVTDAFASEDVKTLDRSDRSLSKWKQTLKSDRRKETLCLRKIPHSTALEKSAWFYLSNNCCMSMLYNLRRVTEICKEHVDNNFLPLPASCMNDFESVRNEVSVIFSDTIRIMNTSATEAIKPLRRHCDLVKDRISEICTSLHHQLREGPTETMTVLYVYLNLLQETQEMVSALRKYLRAYAKLHLTTDDYRA